MPFAIVLGRHTETPQFVCFLIASAVHQSRARGTQRPSLLLNHGKAADVDLETIYRLAVEGLDELCDRDEALAPFRKVRPFSKLVTYALTFMDRQGMCAHSVA